jgi:hypothetical protein
LPNPSIADNADLFVSRWELPPHCAFGCLSSVSYSSHTALFLVVLFHATRIAIREKIGMEPAVEAHGNSWNEIQVETEKKRARIRHIGGSEPFQIMRLAR